MLLRGLLAGTAALAMLAPPGATALRETAWASGSTSGGAAAPRLTSRTADPPGEAAPPHEPSRTARLPGEAAAPRDRSARSLRSVPLKAWLVGGSLAALVASNAMRPRGSGPAQGDKAAGKPAGPSGWQRAASGWQRADPPALEAAPLLPKGGGPGLRDKVEVVAILAMWMVISPLFTMLNKLCFTWGGFPFPVTLTALHMGSCFVVFGAISWLPRRIRAWVMPDVDTPIPCDVYLKGFVPAALLMAVSLGLGNLALLHTSVIFTQLIKPLNVVITSVAAFAWGLEVPTLTHLLTVAIVAGGVCVAAFGGAEFSRIGLICQLTASASEGLRLIVLQGVMQTNLKLDPVTTVYRFAPLASVVLCFMSFLLENPLDLTHVHAPGMILMNCLSAVILNILIALVISRTSAVVSVLAGITKDIGTIFVSSYLFAQPLTSTDMLGYGMSLTGICMYKVYKDRLTLFVKDGFIGGWRQVICSFLVRPE